MLRQRLVRQSALNISSGSDSTMPSPPPVRRRRNSHDTKMYRQLSSESLDQLIASPPSKDERRGGRRHSVACSVMYVDLQKPNLKAAFNSAVRRMSDACAMFSSAPSSTYNLSPHPSAQLPKKEEEVLLPHVLGTFRHNFVPQISSTDKKQIRNNFQVNRRFSTDPPPPSYTEAVGGWKQPVARQKLLARQNEVACSTGSLVAVEDDDSNNLEE